MKQMYVILCLVAVCTWTACGHAPSKSTDTAVRTVEISDVVKPSVLYAGVGEEVRWMNLSENPVMVGFLNTRVLERVGCEKGMTDLFGQVKDLVKIPSGGSISLCFLQSGDHQYNVWFDAENPKGAISSTLIVRVEEG